VGLPVQELKPLLQACSKGTEERQQITLDAVNRRGQQFRCQVTCLPLSGLGGGEVTGIIVMMEPQDA
jgi:two-component system CheB/CheR fusion protein